MGKNKATYSAVLGIVLANLRKQKSIDQGRMASKMGLTQASYSRLESGKSTFSIDQMYQAASALELSGKEVITEVEYYLSHLKEDGHLIVPQARGNSSQSQSLQNGSKNNDIPELIAGVALGALLIAILSKK